jgi:hypothetical protein
MHTAQVFFLNEHCMKCGYGKKKIFKRKIDFTKICVSLHFVTCASNFLLNIWEFSAFFYNNLSSTVCTSEQNEEPVFKTYNV